MGDFEGKSNDLIISIRDILAPYMSSPVRVITSLDKRLQELHDCLRDEYHDNSVYDIVIYIDTFCTDDDIQYDFIGLGHYHDTDPLYVYLNEDDRFAIYNKNDTLISDCIDTVQSCKLELRQLIYNRSIYHFK
jgi:hypothetical protein